MNHEQIKNCTITTGHMNKRNYKNTAKKYYPRGAGSLPQRMPPKTSKTRKLKSQSAYTSWKSCTCFKSLNSTCCTYLKSNNTETITNTWLNPKRKTNPIIRHDTTQWLDKTQSNGWTSSSLSNIPWTQHIYPYDFSRHEANKEN